MVRSSDRERKNNNPASHPTGDLTRTQTSRPRQHLWPRPDPPAAAIATSADKPRCRLRHALGDQVSEVRAPRMDCLGKADPDEPTLICEPKTPKPTLPPKRRTGQVVPMKRKALAVSHALPSGRSRPAGGLLLSSSATTPITANELDVPISGIQLSDQFHREAFDVAIRGRRSRRSRPHSP
jgi:hypothetical protein